MFVEYFKAKKCTNRFNYNQKVFISLNCANNLYIKFRYRGKGRWVKGVIDKFHASVGEIKTIDVGDGFCSFIKERTKHG